MREKLTAKHPRTTDARRAPVRPGAPRKPLSDAPAKGDAPRAKRTDAGAPRKPRVDGGAPRAPRANFDGPRKPRADGDAPRAPRANFDGPRKPRTDGDAPRAPRANFDGPRKPRADGDAPRAPRANFDGPRKPRADGDAPRAPRANFDGPRKPRADGDAPRAPRANFDGPRKPRADGDAPRAPLANFDGPRKPRADGDAPRAPRANFDGPRKPRADGDAPRAPRANFDGPRKPRFDGDAPRAPRANSDGPRKPRADGDAPRAPRTNFDAPRKPRFDGDAPRSPRANFDGPRPPRTDGDAPRAPRANFDAPRKPRFGADAPRPAGDAPVRRTVTNAAGAPKRSHAPQAREESAPTKRESRAHAEPAEPREPSEQAPRDENADETGMLRLSKRMSELGLCSRREADEWIEKGWVRVDGVRIDTLGTKVRPDQNIEILPRARAQQAQQMTILIHKPVGYVSGQPEDDHQPAVTLVTPDNQWEDDDSGIEFQHVHLRSLAPAGRLDIDSTGLLVMTQDGRVARQLIGEDSEVDKEYLVRVNYNGVTTDVQSAFPSEQVALLCHGLSLDDQPLKPALVEWQNPEQLRFVLHEGKKRQIRRMCELVGLEVVGLKRIRIGTVMLGALPAGKWRYLRVGETFVKPT